MIRIYELRGKNHDKSFRLLNSEIGNDQGMTKADLIELIEFSSP